MGIVGGGTIEHEKMDGHGLPWKAMRMREEDAGKRG